MMKSKTPIPKRKSPRLPEYDYALAGGYFITIVTHKHLPFFGKVVDGEMQKNEAGWMIQKEWLCLHNHFSGIELDEFIVMPNHFHGILFITETNVGEGLVPSRQCLPERNVPLERAPTRDAPTLSEIIGAFKSKTTSKYIQGVKEHNWPTYHDRLWQRSFYDRVIRDESELDKLREYIHHNVSKWMESHAEFDKLRRGVRMGTGHAASEKNKFNTLTEGK